MSNVRVRNKENSQLVSLCDDAVSLMADFLKKADDFKKSVPDIKTFEICPSKNKLVAYQSLVAFEAPLKNNILTIKQRAIFDRLFPLIYLSKIDAANNEIPKEIVKELKDQIEGIKKDYDNRKKFLAASFEKCLKVKIDEKDKEFFSLCNKTEVSALHFLDYTMKLTNELLAKIVLMMNHQKTASLKSEAGLERKENKTPAQSQLSSVPEEDEHEDEEKRDNKDNFSFSYHDNLDNHADLTSLPWNLYSIFKPAIGAWDDKQKRVMLIDTQADNREWPTSLSSRSR